MFAADGSSNRILSVPGHNERLGHHVKRVVLCTIEPKSPFVEVAFDEEVRHEQLHIWIPAGSPLARVIDVAVSRPELGYSTSVWVSRRYQSSCAP